MLENFREKVESVADNYADMIDRTIKETTATEVLESGKLTEINDGIRLLNTLANVFERLDRVQENRSAHGQHLER